MIETSGIDHIVLHVDDPQKSKKFYTEILGMSVYRDSDRQVFMHAGHQGVALFKKQGDTPLTTGNDLNHLAFDDHFLHHNPVARGLDLQCFLWRARVFQLRELLSESSANESSRCVRASTSARPNRSSVCSASVRLKKSIWPAR